MDVSPMKLTRRHERLILAMLEEPTLKQAARRARVSQATATRWQREPSFIARLQKERNDLFATGKAQLFSAMSESIATLLIAQRESGCPWNARVNAAFKVLALCLRMKENEIADQLDRLENGDQDEEILGEVVQ